MLSGSKVSDTSPENPVVEETVVVPPTVSSIRMSGTRLSFEESFYQDLSDFFNSDTNYYQDIEGEY